MLNLLKDFSPKSKISTCSNTNFTGIEIPPFRSTVKRFCLSCANNDICADATRKVIISILLVQSFAYGKDILNEVLVKLFPGGETMSLISQFHVPFGLDVLSKPSLSLPGFNPRANSEYFTEIGLRIEVAITNSC